MPGIDPDRSGLVNPKAEKQRKSCFLPPAAGVAQKITRRFRRLEVAVEVRGSQRRVI
jgi:hypothetical protein